MSLREFRAPNGGQGPRPFSFAHLPEDFAVVLLHRDFYASDCRQQVQQVKRRYDEFEARDAVVVSVLPESARRAEEWASQYGLPFPVVADADAELGDRFDQPRRYGILGRVHDVLGRMPTVVVLDLRKREPDPVYIYRGESPADRPTVDELLEQLDRLRPVERRDTRGLGTDPPSASASGLDLDEALSDAVEGPRRPEVPSEGETDEPHAGPAGGKRATTPSTPGGSDDDAAETPESASADDEAETPGTPSAHDEAEPPGTPSTDDEAEPPGTPSTDDEAETPGTSSTDEEEEEPSPEDVVIEPAEPSGHEPADSTETDTPETLPGEPEQPGVGGPEPEGVDDDADEATGAAEQESEAEGAEVAVEEAEPETAESAPTAEPGPGDEAGDIEAEPLSERTEPQESEPTEGAEADEVEPGGVDVEPATAESGATDVEEVEPKEAGELKQDEVVGPEPDPVEEVPESDVDDAGQTAADASEAGDAEHDAGDASAPEALASGLQSAQQHADAVAERVNEGGSPELEEVAGDEGAAAEDDDVDPDDEGVEILESDAGAGLAPETGETITDVDQAPDTDDEATAPAEEPTSTPDEPSPIAGEPGGTTSPAEPEPTTDEPTTTSQADAPPTGEEASSTTEEPLPDADEPAAGATEPETESEPEPGTESESEPESEPGTESEPEPETESEPELTPEPDTALPREGPGGVAIREATSEDRMPVVQVIHGALLDLEVDVIDAALADGDVLVAVDGNWVVGALILGDGPVDESLDGEDLPDDARHILTLAVRRERRRQGVGSAMVEAAIDREGTVTADFRTGLREFWSQLDFDIHRTEDRLWGEHGG